MSGTAADDLLIGHWAGARLGRDPEALIEQRQARGGWKAALAGASGLGAPFEQALAKGAADAELARLAADDLLGARLGARPAELAAVRAGGASTNETILAVVLARRAGATPLSISTPVKSGRATWGRVLQGLGLTPKDVDGLVRQVLAR
jgi:hypothetical protein